MEVVIPTWQWIIENRFEIGRLIHNWFCWRISKMIPVTAEMRQEKFLCDLRRYLK